MEHPTEPVTMWFDRRLVMRSSPIHGIGTFATHVIHAGERIVWVSGGIVCTIMKWVKKLRPILPIVKHPPTIGSNHEIVGQNFVVPA